MTSQRRVAGRSQKAQDGTPKPSGEPRARGALSQDLETLLKPPARKYHNQPVEIDGMRFDSAKEGRRYAELSAAQLAGAINGLHVHTRFPLVVHGQDCGVYVADFTYRTADGEKVVEDVKSPATRKLPTFRLKAKLVWALYGLTIREV